MAKRCDEAYRDRITSDVEDNRNCLRSCFGRKCRRGATRYRNHGDPSLATLWPSTKPVSARPRRNSARTSPESSAVLALRYPITGSGARSARGAAGHATAAPPSSVMNARRLMLTKRLPPPACPILPRRGDSSEQRDERAAPHVDHGASSSRLSHPTTE